MATVEQFTQKRIRFLLILDFYISFDIELHNEYENFVYTNKVTFNYYVEKGMFQI